MDAIKPIVTYYRETKPIENTKGKQPTGRNVGKLVKVMNLPLEMFFEVCLASGVRQAAASTSRLGGSHVALR